MLFISEHSPHKESKCFGLVRKVFVLFEQLNSSAQCYIQDYWTNSCHFILCPPPNHNQYANIPEDQVWDCRAHIHVVWMGHMAAHLK